MKRRKVLNPTSNLGTVLKTMVTVIKTEVESSLSENIYSGS
jgi:hypothetical protein